jgi:hypothetical protein
MAAYARIKLEQRISRLRMQYYRELQLRERPRASLQRVELPNFHREDILPSYNPFIMSNIIRQVVPRSADSILSDKHDSGAGGALV